MKMRLVALLAFVAISIFSYGFVGMVYAAAGPADCTSTQVWQNNECTEASKPLKNNLNLKTDQALYAQGGLVVVSGIVDNIEKLGSGDVSIIVRAPDNNIVTIAQVHPSASGSFEIIIKADGPQFKTPGEYIVIAQFSTLKSEIKFNFTGGTGAIISGGDATTNCQSDETLVNGKCVSNNVTEPVPTEPVPTEPVPTEPVPTEPVPTEPEPICGAGTESINGICQVTKTETNAKGGGCLIATAAYGTELAPQVQLLREIRDNTVMSTASGMSFMTGFNDLYYAFSPTIADLEREHPMFKEVVRAFITPMISTLSIMTLAEDGSDAQVLGLGISVIVLNLGMYIAAPTVIGFKVHKHLKSRK